MKKLWVSLIGLAMLLLPTMAAAQINPTPGTAGGSWNYAAASGGIVDTTAVTVKAAAGAGKKNWLSSVQLSNSGAAGTEVIFRCGSAGTVMWRGWVGATASNVGYTFDKPISCTANTLIEVVLSSSTTVAVRVNAQGYTD